MQVNELDITAEDVLHLAYKYQWEMPMCRGAWGALDKNVAHVVDHFIGMGEGWGTVEFILPAVIARDLGEAVCAEGLVGLAAWDLSDGYMPTAVNLYDAALEWYAGESLNSMWFDHDKHLDVTEGWGASKAIHNIGELLGL